MKPLILIPLAGGLVAAGLLAGGVRPASAAVRRGMRDAMESAGRRAVLVELFTSEGCSSCPPADAELARLLKDQPIDGADVIALEIHVDYWNNLGWRDPFSSAANTARQNGYARAMRLDSPYTPQMVVDGRNEFVGSDAAAAARAIRASAGDRKADVSVATEGMSLKVRVAGAARGADVILALAEDGLVSSVRAGENAGRRLPHAAVARSLRRIGSVGRDGTFEARVPLVLDAAWKRGGLSAVAFVQERGQGRVLGAARASIGL